MNIYTVSFFGHRKLDNTAEIERELERIIKKLIDEKEYVEFIVGREGEFDLLASSVIRRTIRNSNYGNTSFILVLPYLKAEYRNNEKNFLDYYDEVELCEKSAQSHYKSAIKIRNRYMIDRSDLVICFIKRRKGGAYQAVKYAEKLKLKIINIADMI